MENKESYIEKLLEKVNKSDDKELKELVLRLIDERNYLSREVNIDPLTGLYNRRILNRIRECSVALMCDIDNFKTINDTYGHDIGDDVIRKVANILMRNTRIYDYVCRFGGDEFFAGFINCEENVIYEKCERIQKEVREKVLLPNHIVTLSMGIASSKENESIYDLIKKADEALYNSKENGKNMVSCYTYKKVRKK